MSAQKPASPAMRRVADRSYCNVESGVVMHFERGGWAIYRPAGDGHVLHQSEYHFVTARRNARALAAGILRGEIW
jgi:hypothetical protein